MLKSAILRTSELDMSWVLGVWGGAGLNEMLEEVLILPADQERQVTGAGKTRGAARHCCSTEALVALQKVCTTALGCAHTRQHTPRYLAVGTSSTGQGGVCVSSTLENLDPP